MEMCSSFNNMDLNGPLVPENLNNIFDIAYDSNGCIGNSQFTFHNGDTYSGLFKALKTGIIIREGNGVYTSIDGHVYNGLWTSDILDCPHAQIQFPDGSSYCGPLKNMKYNGRGRYTFPDATFIDAVFSNNLMGEESSTHLSFVDRCGTQWFSETGGSQVAMLPVHHFIPREWKVTGKDVPRVTTASAKAGIALRAALPKFSFPILSRTKLPENGVQMTLMDDDTLHLENEETQPEN